MDDYLPRSNIKWVCMCVRWGKKRDKAILVVGSKDQLSWAKKVKIIRRRWRRGLWGFDWYTTSNLESKKVGQCRIRPPPTRCSPYVSYHAKQKPSLQDKITPTRFCYLGQGLLQDMKSFFSGNLCMWLSYIKCSKVIIFYIECPPLPSLRGTFGSIMEVMLMLIAHYAHGLHFYHSQKSWSKVQDSKY